MRALTAAIAATLLFSAPAMGATYVYVSNAEDGDIGEDHEPETHLIPIAIQTAMGLRGPLEIFGCDYPTDDGTAVRDYVHVNDLATAHVAALKGVGRQAVDAIVEARGDQPFRDITDFASRVNPRAVNKRVLESLAAAGAFDALEKNRARVYAGVDAILATAQRQHEAAEIGQNDMFGGPSMREKIPLPAAEPWLPAERLQREFEAIGFFLSGHPLDDYAGVLKRLNVQSWTAFANSVKQGATAGRVAGTVVARAERRTKTGNRMGILEFSDPSGHYEAVIFQEGLTQYRDLLEPGSAVLLFLTAEAQGDDVRARI